MPKNKTKNTKQKDSNFPNVDCLHVDNRPGIAICHEGFSQSIDENRKANKHSLPRQLSDCIHNCKKKG